MTPAKYKKLNAQMQAVALSELAKETAERCNGNMLLAGTWVQDSFFGLSERIDELAKRLAKESAKK